ncbi:MAG: acyl-CoA thioesterase [Pseudomonadota bacterium]
MYPFVRLFKEFLTVGRKPLDPLGTHVSHHICWPWDIDMFFELNNGRSLTLYDLGRLPLAMRVGMAKALRQQGWGLTMAGASIRWRARIRPFQRFEMHSRALGWDDKFFYLDQSMWLPDGRCASQALYRSAVTDSNGIVTPDRLMVAMGVSMDSPTLPDWVQAWITAEAERPWPPLSPATASTDRGT